MRSPICASLLLFMSCLLGLDAGAADRLPSGQLFTSRAWGARPETEPPGYVRTIGQADSAGAEDRFWLDFGLEHLTRYEWRDGNYAQADLVREDPVLMRSRLYVGIREVWDPFRCGFEFLDARVFNSDYPATDRQKNEADILQAFGELYLSNALGRDFPAAFRAGRMTFDYVDRRIVGRNRWRVTVNAFQGCLLRLGDPGTPWQWDAFAVRPVQRRLDTWDRADPDRWLYGLVGARRDRTCRLILEPYYFLLDQDPEDATNPTREIHTTGLHLFGLLGSSGYDYDADVAWQFGRDGGRDHRAFALYTEAGYTASHRWRPRLAASFMYATGDGEAADDRSERFDRLFQVRHCYSQQDYWTWQNVINPTVRCALRPRANLRVEASHGAFWLADAGDAWVVTGRRDATGSGDRYVGQEFDLRVRRTVGVHLEVEAGYSLFFAGTFAANTGAGRDTNMLYGQVTLRY